MLWSVLALGKRKGEGGQVSQKLNSSISFGFIISRDFTCSQADTHKTHGLCIRCASPCICVICVLEENKESSCGSCPEGAYALAHCFPSSLSRVGWIRLFCRRSRLYQLDQESAGQGTQGWAHLIEPTKSRVLFLLQKVSLFIPLL